MALRGSIEDIPIVDVLQFVHLSGKSGVLTVATSRGQAGVEFREGDIAFAWCPDTRPLGELLVEEHLVSRSDVDEAIAEQRLGARGTPLGQLLVAAGHISRQALAEAVKKQIRHAMKDVLSLRHGGFKFDQSAAEVPDDIRLDTSDLLPLLRLNTQFLLLDSMREFDEAQKSELSPPQPASLAPVVPPDDDDDDAAEDEVTRPVRKQRPAGMVPTEELPVALEEDGPSGPDDPVAILRQPPRVVAEPTFPPPGSAQGGPPNLTPQPGRLQSGRGGVVLVGFDKSLGAVLSGALSTHGFPIRAQVALADVTRHLLEGRQWAAPVTFVWWVGAEAGPADESQRLLAAVHGRYPSCSIVGLVGRLDAMVAGRLYSQGVRAVIPVDTGAAPEAALGGLLNVMGQLWQENARFADTQAAELRAWLHAKKVTTEMHKGTQRAAVALELMRVASTVFERAALFLVRGNDLVGLGAFGATLSGQTMADAVRGLALAVPRDTPAARSLAASVVITGRVREFGLSPLFFDIAGEPLTRLGALVPLVGSSRAVGILYGDNGRLSTGLRPLHPIELAASQAGVAYENAMLRGLLGRTKAAGTGAAR